MAFQGLGLSPQPSPAAAFLGSFAQGLNNFTAYGQQQQVLQQRQQAQDAQIAQQGMSALFQAMQLDNSVRGPALDWWAKNYGDKIGGVSDTVLAMLKKADADQVAALGNLNLHSDLSTMATALRDPHVAIQLWLKGQQQATAQAGLKELGGDTTATPAPTSMSTAPATLPNGAINPADAMSGLPAVPQPQQLSMKSPDFLTQETTTLRAVADRYRRIAQQQAAAGNVPLATQLENAAKVYESRADEKEKVARVVEVPHPSGQGNVQVKLNSFGEALGHEGAPENFKTMTVLGPDGLPTVFAYDTSKGLSSARAIGHAPGAETPFTRNDIDQQLRLQGLTPGTLAYQQAYNSLARIVPVQAGGQAYGAGGIGSQFGGTPPPTAAPAPTGAPTGPPTPAPLVQVPARPEAGEVDKVAALKTFSTQARKVADDLEQLAPDTRARVSLALRQTAQGIPLASAIASLSPEEQDVVTRLGDLRLSYERSKGGARLASSPGMASRITAITGNPSGATTPTALRALADSADADLKDLQSTMTQSGRANISGQSAGGQSAKPSGKDQVSRSSPEYRKARAAGLSDDQIRSKYGVEIVP